MLCCSSVVVVPLSLNPFIEIRIRNNSSSSDVLYIQASMSISSGGSRISHRGGMDLRCGHFSVKMYTKTKELDPIGGHALGTPPLDPPMISPKYESK